MWFPNRQLMHKSSSVDWGEGGYAFVFFGVGFVGGQLLLGRPVAALEIMLPQAFIRDLPPFALEGEIWGGRGRFEETVAIVKRQAPDKRWLSLKFAIFDVPKAAGSFTARMVKAEKWFEQHPSSMAFIIPQFPVHDRLQLKQELRRIEQLGGEGLIVRAPEALYTSGRSPKILKVKSFQDAEARVVAQLPGKGKNRGKMGALLES